MISFVFCTLGILNLDKRDITLDKKYSGTKIIAFFKNCLHCTGRITRLLSVALPLEGKNDRISLQYK